MPAAHTHKAHSGACAGWVHPQFMAPSCCGAFRCWPCCSSLGSTSLSGGIPTDWPGSHTTTHLLLRLRSVSPCAPQGPSSPSLPGDAASASGPTSLILIAVLSLSLCFSLFSPLTTSLEFSFESRVLAQALTLPRLHVISAFLCVSFILIYSLSLFFLIVDSLSVPLESLLEC